MKYLLVILIAALLCLPFTSNAFAWEPPLECADEDREIQGNRTTPCKLVLPEKITLEYRFRMDYPYCIEEMAFHIPGVGRTEKPVVTDADAMMRTEDGIFRGGGYGWLGYYYDGLTALDDYLVFQPSLPGYTVDSGVSAESRFGNPTPGYDHVALQIEVDGISKGYRLQHSGIPRPSTNSKLDLANSCLALLVQEKRDREHAEQLRQEEAEKQAELLVQREAQLKAEEQAKREAEKQARIAKLELQTILENKIAVANTELIKTETLVAQLEHEKVIGAILREIINIRLTGEER